MSCSRIAPTPRRLGRRGFLLGASAAGAALGAPYVRAAAGPRLPGQPFTLGVASGDSLSDGFVIWTRLAPDPLDGGGMPPEPMPVEWIVASDERLRDVVQSGTATARPEFAHAVHVELRGLVPGRPYWYRFRAGGDASPIGRAMTAPAPGEPFARLRFAFAACQHYEQGYYTAYRAMVGDAPDLVIHLGDYIYETRSGGDEIRRHDGPEPTDLAGYRNRYALYKLDPELQAAHAACSWLVTWDDHEVQNDYAGDQSQNRDDPAEFLKRRAAAFRAYWEHMPLRRSALPEGPNARLYQRYAFGDLVEFSLLDGRQYRNDQPCADGRAGGGILVGEECRQRFDPQMSMLGPEQERWLAHGLGRGGARWNVVAQQTMMAPLARHGKKGRLWWTDSWDGYAAARERLLATIRDRRIVNPVVISGDIHSFWVNDLKVQADDPAAPTVATEFIGGSITSTSPPYEQFAAYLPDNPHIRFFDSRRHGYALCEVTKGQWRTDFRAVDTVQAPASPAATLASFVVEDGRPGAQPA